MKKASRLLFVISMILLAVSASLFAWRYAGADKVRVLSVDQVRALPAAGGSYRSINNWKTVEVTSFKGVRVYDLLRRSGVDDADATVKLIAPDGYFWPKVGTTMTLRQLARPNPSGVYPLIAFDLDGKPLDPEPDGSGPLRYVAPQYSVTETNKPSWVSNLRLVQVGPLEKGAKAPDAKKVPVDQLWVYGDVPVSYPVGLVAPLLTGIIGLVVLILSIFTRGVKHGEDLAAGGPGAAVLIMVLVVVASMAMGGFPPSCGAQQAPIVFSKAQLTSMPAVSAHYTFLKQQPPYTYYEADYKGVALPYLLGQKLQLQPGASQVVVRARDGYLATLSLAQVNASYPGNAKHPGSLQVMIAYAKEGGQPLSGDEGPLKLVVPQSKPGNHDQGSDPNTPLCVRMAYAVEVQPLPAGVSQPDPATVPAGSIAVYGAVSTPAPAPAATTPQAAPTLQPQPTVQATDPAATSPAASPAATTGNAALDALITYYGDSAGLGLSIAATALLTPIPRPLGITLGLLYSAYRVTR